MLRVSKFPFAGAVEAARFLSSQAAKPLQVGILRENYNKWERRVPLCPEHVRDFLSRNPGSSVIVQPSQNRIFSCQEYENAGAIIQDDLSDADLILGVKRPKQISDLPPDKTYMFFSHVIKGQPENMALLRACIDRHVQLMDYECIVESSKPGALASTKRLIAFGKYAGYAGMVDTFPALGRRLLMKGWTTPFLTCPPAIHHFDMTEVRQSVSLLGERLLADGLPDDMEPLVFILTGKGGKVYGGVRELLDILPHEEVGVDDLPYLNQQTGSQHKIYCVAPEKHEIYQRSDGVPFDRSDYMQNPHLYKSVFADKIAPYGHVVMNCAYWDHRYPRLLTKDDIQLQYENGDSRLLIVSDISCDVGGSIEFFERSTTIDKPSYQYDPVQGREVSDHISDQGVTMLGVDILPTELPADSSRHFGNALNGLLDQFVHAKVGDAKFDTIKLSKELQQSIITTSTGELATGFRYLGALMQPKKEQTASTEDTKNMVLLLEGHLFDSGLINQVLNLLENYQCSFEFTKCNVPHRVNADSPVKSSAVLNVTAGLDVDFSTVAKKIHDLVEVLDSADATMKVFDQENRPAYVQDPDEKTVLLIGSGLVSRSVVDLLGRSKNRTIIVASNDEEDARTIARVARRGRHACLDVLNDEEGLNDLIKRADVVISLLPAPMHPLIAEKCISQKRDMVTASYESDRMRELHEEAVNAGIVIVNEVGLDPGLDHMSAMKIIHDIQGRDGVVTKFSSVCGGLPAPDAADNPLKYKFSWSPRGVISASQNAARYRENGMLVEVDGNDLLSSFKLFPDAVWPDLQLECLPNRNSLLYEKTYGIYGAEHIFRGTLRYEGFSSLMHCFKEMGLFQTNTLDASTWKEVIEKLHTGGIAKTLPEFLLKCAGGDAELASRTLSSLDWLGMTGDIEVAENQPLVDLFCSRLEAMLQYKKHERDMVVMHHDIEAVFPDGSSEHHQSSLKVFGDDAMSSMCRTVGYPTAAATELVLGGELGATRGLLLPTTANVYEPILAAMTKEGIVFDESVDIITHPRTQTA
eukprot:Nitzschia sp. Nitz4//scaffold5_size260463//155252//158658//NITZ4_000992-RA/size260463-augustus-gene-0.35-mRNA-1//-1//CDS//3329555370//7203//frame0